MDKPKDSKPKEAHSKSPNPSGREGKPISLCPLTPEEAIRAILSVSPEVKEQHSNKH